MERGEQARVFALHSLNSFLHKQVISMSYLLPTLARTQWACTEQLCRKLKALPRGIDGLILYSKCRMSRCTTVAKMPRHIYEVWEYIKRHRPDCCRNNGSCQTLRTTMLASIRFRCCQRIFSTTAVTKSEGMNGDFQFDITIPWTIIFIFLAKGSKGAILLCVRVLITAHVKFLVSLDVGLQ